MNLVIKNTEPRLVVLPGLPVEQNKAGKVTAPGWSEHRLLPGENDVDSGYWERVTKKGAVKIFLAAGLLKNEGEGKAQVMVLSLDKLKGQDAMMHISKCTSVQVLNEWKAATENPVIRSAIQDRIQELIVGATGAAPEGTADEIIETTTD